jgi:hypothetical protein
LDDLSKALGLVGKRLRDFAACSRFQEKTDPTLTILNTTWRRDRHFAARISPRPAIAQIACGHRRCTCYTCCHEDHIFKEA